jgi:hypothetical protein
VRERIQSINRLSVGEAHRQLSRRLPQTLPRSLVRRRRSVEAARQGVIHVHHESPRVDSESAGRYRSCRRRYERHAARDRGGAAFNGKDAAAGFGRRIRPRGLERVRATPSPLAQAPSAKVASPLLAPSLLASALLGLLVAPWVPGLRLAVVLTFVVENEKLIGGIGCRRQRGGQCRLEIDAV